MVRRHTLLLDTGEYTENSNKDKECLDWGWQVKRLFKWGGLGVTPGLVCAPRDYLPLPPVFLY